MRLSEHWKPLQAERRVAILWEPRTHNTLCRGPPSPTRSLLEVNCHDEVHSPLLYLGAGPGIQLRTMPLMSIGEGLHKSDMPLRRWPYGGVGGKNVEQRLNEVLQMLYQRAKLTVYTDLVLCIYRTKCAEPKAGGQ